MAPINKLLRKIKAFEWTKKCQSAWEVVKQCYMDALDYDFVPLGLGVLNFFHTNASNMAIGIMLAQNPTEKCDQMISYASQLLNHIKQNYMTIEREAFSMVYALHKFYHYFFGNIFIVYVDHMAPLYLIWKPKNLGQITTWLLFFLEYIYFVVHKSRIFHLAVDTLSH
jgi:hypothetical protein